MSDVDSTGVGAAGVAGTGVGSDRVGIVFGPAGALRSAYRSAIDRLDGWSLELAAFERRIAPLIGEWIGSWPHHHAALAADRLRIDHADLAWRLDWILQTEAQPIAGIYSLPTTPNAPGSLWDLVIDVALVGGEARWSAILALAPLALEDAAVGQTLIDSLGPSWFTVLVGSAIDLLVLAESSHDQATNPLVWGPPSGTMQFDGFDTTAADIDVMVDAMGVLLAAATMTDPDGLISMVEGLDDEQLGQLLVVMHAGTYDGDFLVAVGRRLAVADTAVVTAVLPGGRRWLTGFATVNDEFVDPVTLFLEAVLRQPAAAGAIVQDEALAPWLLDVSAVHSAAGAPPYPVPIADLRAQVMQAAFAWADAAGPIEVHRIWNGLAPAIETNGVDLPAAMAVGDWLVAHWYLVVPDPTRSAYSPAMGAAVLPVLLRLFEHAVVREAVLAGVIDDAMRRLDLTMNDLGDRPVDRVDVGIRGVNEAARLVWLALAEQAATARAANNGFDGLVANVLAVLRTLAGPAISSLGVPAVPARLLLLAANEVAADLLDGSPTSLPDFDEFLSAVALAEVPLEPPSSAQLPVPFPVGIQVRYLQILLDARPDLQVHLIADSPWFRDGEIQLPESDPVFENPEATAAELYDFAVWFQSTTSGSHNELTDLYSLLEASLGPG